MPAVWARLGLAGVGAATALGLSGCGNLDTEKLEGEIRKNIGQRAQITGVNVDCPRGVEQKKGKDFDCRVSGGASGTVHVTQTNDDGNVTYDLSKLKIGR